MKRIIYHGSSQRLEKPYFGGGKSHNDYGSGFYCTEDRAMACEWAVGETHDGWINQYEIDCGGLSLLNLNDKRFCILHWLEILLENRSFDLSYALAQEARKYLLENFSVDYADKDVVVGYRADDSYFSFAQDFLMGAISYRQLCNAMHLGRLGCQFVLKSPRAFERLCFLNAEPVSRNEWYPRRAQRDIAARQAYFSSRGQKRRAGDLYIIQILDEKIKPDDSRLR